MREELYRSTSSRFTTTRGRGNSNFYPLRCDATTKLFFPLELLVPQPRAPSHPVPDERSPRTPPPLGPGPSRPSRPSPGRSRIYQRLNHRLAARPASLAGSVSTPRRSRQPSRQRVRQRLRQRILVAHVAAQDHGERLVRRERPISRRRLEHFRVAARAAPSPPTGLADASLSPGTDASHSRCLAVVRTRRTPPR